MSVTIASGRSRIRSHHRWLLAALLGPLFILPVLAGGFFAPTLSSTGLPRFLSVPGNASVGETLWTSDPNRSTSEIRLDIAADDQSEIHADIENGSRIGNSNIYATNTPGIGVRWWGNWNGRDLPAGGITLPITTFQENVAPPPRLIRGDRFPQSVWFELVKTGNIVTGGRDLAVLSNAWVRYSCSSPCVHWRIRVTGVTRLVETTSCSVANPTQTVPLGRVSITRFTGVGSVSAATPFSIRLNCTGGAPGSATRPHVTLTDGFDNTNRSTTLSLGNAASRATGIGIQILRNGTVLGYGPASSEPGTVNQWEAGTVREGEASFEIALAARYVQTQAAVGAGVANGRVIFTMNYQ